ncbi:ABC transporter ATP-binding protein [Sphingobacterium faecium]|jgi:ABC-2 type transport system ATP-binding protein|uniref:ABC transporter ATP-binding protein n=1 Tax=Sphingobacterium faecium TaxID=34087 RepID=UPI00097EDA2C|nr:ABC transporter ATP-binding protein [Sphingobacterium faecium]WGQ15227.1 ABC transporter ATP-binding protein [Sphingobacterium faecium]SJN26149.1 ABC transporter, ATP-binding protein [Sphingobacterium faecium PCAi_F2.5]
MLLEIKNVVKDYASHRALDHVSLNIPRGKIFGLLGPNGAGKTSLIRIINQITGPDSGEIIFDGEPLAPKHIGRIGYLPEERGLYKKMKIGEQMLYLAQLKGLNKKEATDRINYWFEKLDILSWWDKRVEDLSKGMQQKVQFIATVLHQPDLIILDEPFSGFDPVNANLIKDEIIELNKKGATIIFSTHRMESVEELCDHIALINRSKKILDGNIKDIKNKYKNQTYKIELQSLADEKLIHIENLYELKYLEQIENKTNIIIKINKDISINQVLQSLLPLAEIHQVLEIVPSINDIFIEQVTLSNNSKKEIDHA